MRFVASLGFLPHFRFPALSNGRILSGCLVFQVENDVTILSFCCSVAAVIAPGSSHDAATISSLDPNSIVTFLRVREANDPEITLLGGKKDDPLIIVRRGDGTMFTIVFYDCDAHEQCASLTFRNAWEMKSPAGPSLEKINEWNRVQRFGRAHIDEVLNPVLEMGVMMAGGTLPVTDFDDRYQEWKGAIIQFEDHIGWNDYCSCQSR